MTIISQSGRISCWIDLSRFRASGKSARLRHFVRFLVLEIPHLRRGISELFVNLFGTMHKARGIDLMIPVILCSDCLSDTVSSR